MRGNRLARGGDPMKSRSERRKERQKKISKSGRAIRLKKRLSRIRGHDASKQKDGHTTAIMESYILRRKAERAEEKRRREEEEGDGEEEEDLNDAPVVAKKEKVTAKKEKPNKKKELASKSASNAKRAAPVSSKKITPRSLY
ncbi:hypothetical protein ADEAN_000371100 [Angomonas deanei]|uniref:Uncharacterized protein n=1 Tax=Angomonas deanei TaxID=59799 RepID=A0A7G2C8W1_9TRYP|nr:hypothetical protein ADEAN_000371100 [Angomonas deanei]